MQDLVRATLNNIKAIVEAGGSSLDHVLRVNCYLRDVENDFPAWNEVYREFFPKDWPVRTTVQVLLGGGLRIEVDAIAGIPDGASPTRARSVARGRQTPAASRARQTARRRR